MPAEGPSPCSERNSSVMRSDVTCDMGRALAGPGAPVLSTGSTTASVLAAAAQRELLLAVEALPCVGGLASGPGHPVVPAAAGAGDALALARAGSGFGWAHADPPGTPSIAGRAV